jgi:cobalt-zinc-cadmium efflux system outer membrane protein
MTDLRLAAAKGLSDPTVRLGVACKPLYDPSIAFSVSLPFRILGHNQGGRRDTHLDIDRKARLRNAGRAQVLGDVDCAYAGVDRTAALFKPYRDGYPQPASSARDTIAFSLRQGAASLPDSLEARAEDRRVQVNHLNLMASYLKAANQLNLAVAREVTP